MNRKAIFALAVPLLVIFLVIGKNIFTLMKAHDEDFSTKGGIVVTAKEFNLLKDIRAPLVEGKHAIAVALRGTEIKKHIVTLVQEGKTDFNWIALASKEKNDQWKVIFRENGNEVKHMCKIFIDSASTSILSYECLAK